MGAEPDAAPGDDVGIGHGRARDLGLPRRGRGGGVEHAEPTGIADVPAPELERIEPGGDRQFVDRLLGGEREREIERRAQRRALSSPTIGTAWLTTRRFATVYIEPVLMRLTGIDIGPLVRSFGG